MGGVKGRRLKTADQKRKTAFKKMIEAFAVALVFLLIAMFIGFEDYPEYEQLKCYKGKFTSIEVRKDGNGRRSGRNAHGLVFEDGSSFYIHNDFDKQHFLETTVPGDELIVFAYTHSYIEPGSDDGVAYEIRTPEGNFLRSYDETMAFKNEHRHRKTCLYGVFAILMAAFGTEEFFSWRKFDKKVREMLERKSGEVQN